MSKSLKIISWNVNGVRALHKKGLRSFLERQKPDVFCMQETKSRIDQLKDEQYLDLYPYGNWSSATTKAGYSGTATLSKEEPIEVYHGIQMEQYDAEGRFVVTKFPEFLLYNVYFPNGGMGIERQEYKMQFLADFTDHLAEKIAMGEKIILVGDYNVAHTEIDVHDPIRLSSISGFLPEEREWFSEFLDVGFVDTFRHFNPGVKNKYTWWSYRERGRENNRGWRIDYMCVTPDLLPFIKSFKHLDQQVGSDHCPLEMVLKF